MSERITLKALKGMSDEELYQHWRKGRFPFENMLACSRCLTLHYDTELAGCHPALTERIIFLGQPVGEPPTKKFLHDHLEELYALRLFYDHLYPQPASEPAAVEEAQSVPLSIR